DDPVLAGELADHDRGGKARVDIAAGEDQADALAAETGGLGEERGERGGAGALGHGLLQHEEFADGAFDMPFADDDHPVDDPAADFDRQAADILHRDALGEGIAAASGGLTTERGIE